MIELHGHVASITFRNEDNGYTVLRFMPQGASSTVVCTGITPALQKGQQAKLTCSRENNPRYGLQYKISSYTLIAPKDSQSIQRLLGSGLIAHLGPSKAERIVARFGEKTLDVLNDSPQRITEVEGIGPKTAKKIIASWNKQRHLEAVMRSLLALNLSPHLIQQCYKVFGPQADVRIQENPYLLIEKISGVGFARADEIAQKIGFEKNSFKRIRAGIIHCLNEASQSGHLYLDKDKLLNNAVSLLDVQLQEAVFSLDHLLEVGKKVVEQQGHIYLRKFYIVEKNSAQILHKLLQQPRNQKLYAQASAALEGMNAQSYLAHQQLQAVQMAISHPVCIITGGPGTGKTTTLKSIVALFKKVRVSVGLCAPTGRAAQRMSQSSNHPAATIHRLLEYQPFKGSLQFARNEQKRLDFDCVIVDEASMIDCNLLFCLLRAIKDDGRIIFVGDHHQLPSIGPGNCLLDMIQSNQIPTVQLTEVFRQAARSKIISYSHDLMHGVCPVFTNQKNDDCFFLHRKNPIEAQSEIVELFCNRLKSSYGFSPREQIMILSPMHRGELGTIELNSKIQSTLHPGKDVQNAHLGFLAGDRVMQVRNNYDTGIFNGDIGIVQSADKHGLQVSFSKRVVTYRDNQLRDITLAYAVSIHKSQGSEFDAVIIPLLTTHFIMLQRNLVYTALTRARQLAIFCGTTKALRLAVGNTSGLKRNTTLRDYLQNTPEAK